MQKGIFFLLTIMGLVTTSFAQTGYDIRSEPYLRVTDPTVERRNDFRLYVNIKPQMIGLDNESVDVKGFLAYDSKGIKGKCEIDTSFFVYRNDIINLGWSELEHQYFCDTEYFKVNLGVFLGESGYILNVEVSDWYLDSQGNMQEKLYTTFSRRPLHVDYSDYYQIWQ